MQKIFNGLVPQPPFPWFTQLWRRFDRLHSNRQLPHALLLAGPGGVGELDLAYAMGQYLLCAAPQQATSCGSCKACRLVAAGSHPDLAVVTTEEKSRVIKIDRIREVAQFVANTAQQGGRKVVLLYPAEVMNPNAANALLKNLEEPSGDTIFILVSLNPALLMATIRSRCTRFDLVMPAKEEAAAWLERNQVREASTKLASTGGRPITAFEWEQGGAFEKAAALHKTTSAFLYEGAGLAGASKALMAYDLAWVLDCWLNWLQVAIRNASAGTDGVTPFRGSVTDLYGLHDQLLARKQQLVRGNNPNAQLLLEELLLGMSSAAGA